ncbi:aldo/keto reductase [Actinocrispum wychmicini]|uniref:Aryl-alcohol dehydrogenase-like predicted oxidoreductase n=1 Tax=Actinocrispum wychmicini TaxID=1213861 RepID=A0A4R2JSH2_9PSEU|nr:aldo/keto reductase [Actinocrispum wychmicini]TCO62047.1 aryl-alcohol dehydrogenase-like predicted oxidoreductase [Actinocrispum wychmicini]
MQKRLLGQGLTVSAIGFGTLALTGGYGAADELESADTIHAALDAGVTMIDTAGFYADGAVEQLVGKSVAGRRDQVVLATRGGVRAASTGGPPTIVDASPAALRTACDDSLRRLGTDRIDLYYLARVDPKVPVEDSTGALAELVAAGKVRHIGLSEAPPEDLRRASAVHPIAALESEYSLWERHIETAVLPTARELGVPLVAHTPLGKGMLAGAVTGHASLGRGDHRRNHPRFQAGNLTYNRGLVDEAAAIAADLDITVAQLALAWLLGRGTDILPIPGTRRRAHLAANVRACEITLDPVHTARLDEIFAPGRAAGDRHRAS